jgi:hypothetical protein
MAPILPTTFFQLSLVEGVPIEGAKRRPQAVSELPVAEPRLGRRTILTLPLFPPPQKN